MVQWQPYSVKTDFDVKTPVCAACKKTNRTRSFCRARHMHRQLPWCTVFVLLSAVDSTDPSTVVAAPSRPVAPEEQGNEEKESNDEGIKPKEEPDTTKPEDSVTIKPEDSEATTTAVYDTKTIDSKTPEKAENPENGETSNENPESEKPPSPDNDKAVQQPEPNPEGDDINEIDPSRTFLVKVSTKSISIHWLELGGEGYTNTDSEVKALNDAIRSPTIQMPPLLDSSRYYAQMGGNFAFPFQQAQMYPMWGAQPAQYGQQIMQWCGGQMPQQAGQMTPGMAPAAIPVGTQMLAPTPTSTLAPNQKVEGEDGGEMSETKTEEGDKSMANLPAPTPLPAQANASPQDMWQAQVMLQQQMIYAHQQQLMGQMMSQKANEKGEIGVNENGSSSEDKDDPLKKRQRI